MLCAAAPADSLGACAQAAAAVAVARKGGIAETPGELCRADSWTIVDMDEARQLAEAAALATAVGKQETFRKRREERKQRLAKEFIEARDVHSMVHAAVGEAHKKVQEFGSKLAAAQTLDILLMCRLPGTSVQIEHISKSDPTYVLTGAPHGFCTGQQVIISGVGGTTAAWASEINRSHMIAVVNERRFTLTGVGTSGLPGEADSEQAEAASSVMAWDAGSTPRLHSALFSSAEGLGQLGVLRAGQVLHWLLLRSGTVLQDAAKASARRMAIEAGENSEEQSFVPAQDKPTLLQLALRNLGDFQVPEVSTYGVAAWRRCVEATQPEWWEKSSDARVCIECMESFHEASSKHHCRQCGHVLCSSCCGEHELVPWRGYSKKTRVCKSCISLVKMRNAVLRTYIGLWELLELDIAPIGAALPQQALVQQGGKGKGKGKPPKPPPPKSNAMQKPTLQKPIQGHASSSSDGQASQASKADRKHNEMDELAQYVMVLMSAPAPESESPQHVGKSELGGNKLLDKREELSWQVARFHYEPHLEDIARCLQEVTLSGQAGDWIPILEQVLPLEGKLSETTLTRLRQIAEGPPEELANLRIYEQHICRHFLPVPQLKVRFELLSTLHRLETEKANLSQNIDVAKAAYQAPLVSACSSELRSEVHVFLLTFMYVTKQSGLGDLASLGNGVRGQKAYDGIFQDGPLKARCNGEAFLLCLESFVAERFATAMCDTGTQISDFSTQVRLMCEASTDSKDVNLIATAEQLRRNVIELEDRCKDATSVGTHLVQGLRNLKQELSEEPAGGVPGKPMPTGRQLQQELDKCVRDLQHVTKHLRNALKRVQVRNAEVTAVAKPAQPSRVGRQLRTATGPRRSAQSSGSQRCDDALQSRGESCGEVEDRRCSLELTQTSLLNIYRSAAGRPASDGDAEIPDRRSSGVPECMQLPDGAFVGAGSDGSGSDSSSSFNTPRGASEVDVVEELVDFGEEDGTVDQGQQIPGAARTLSPAASQTRVLRAFGGASG